MVGYDGQCILFPIVQESTCQVLADVQVESLGGEGGFVYFVI